VLIEPIKGSLGGEDDGSVGGNVSGGGGRKRFSEKSILGEIKKVRRKLRAHEGDRSQVGERKVEVEERGRGAEGGCSEGKAASDFQVLRRLPKEGIFTEGMSALGIAEICWI